MTQSANVDLTPSTDGLHDLRMHGAFAHPHWVAFLFSGLAAQGISVVSGRAMQTPAGNWNAEFRLDFRRSHAIVQTIDFRALCEKTHFPGTRTELKLLSAHVVRRTDDNLEIRISGPDQVGFLSALISKVSLLGLFPIELEIMTVSARVQDRLVFAGIGGSAPGAGVQSSLQAMLSGLVQL